MEKYIIVYAGSQGKLQVKVNEQMAFGYIPFGSMSVICTSDGDWEYNQPMILYGLSNE